MPPRKAAAKKGASAASKKAAAVSVAEQAAEDSPMEEQAEEQSSNTQESTPALAAEEQSEEVAEAGGTAGASASSMEDRMAKMKALRARMVRRSLSLPSLPPLILHHAVRVSKGQPPGPDHRLERHPRFSAQLGEIGEEEEASRGDGREGRSEGDG